MAIQREALHQIKAKLERGAGQAEHGELTDRDQVFDELREMIEERRRTKLDEPVPHRRD